MDKDYKIRRRIKSIYNQTLDDFPTLLAYQNYEEEVEDIIYNLVHNIDKEKTELAIKTYQLQHVSNITKKQSKMYELEQQEESLIENENLEFKMRQKKFIVSLFCICVIGCILLVRVYCI